MNLKINYCSYKASLFAVKRWHYSKSLPGADLIKFGVWENEKFIGSVIYGRGANKNINKAYKLKANEVCELCRVALGKHISPVSKIVSITLRMMKKDFPKMRLIVSYADTDKGHTGKIYQAMNWIYEGLFAKESGIVINGKLIHRRSVNSKYGTSSIETLKKKFHLQNLAIIRGGGKHRYVMLLDKSLIGAYKEKPYPKTICVSSVNGSTSSFQDERKVQIHSDAQDKTND